MAPDEKTPRASSRTTPRSRDSRGGTGLANRPRGRSGGGGKRWLARADWKMKLLLGVVACIVVVCAVFGIIFGYYYHAYENVVAQRLRPPTSASTWPVWGFIAIRATCG